MDKLMRSKRGFTLIEMLIVIAVIGLLAGLVAPNVVQYMTKGKAESWEADKNTLDAAVESFYIEHKYIGKHQWPTFQYNTTSGHQGGTPTDTTNGDPANPSTAALTLANATTEIDMNLLVPTYIKSVPRSSAADNQINMTSVEEAGSYVWYVTTDGSVEALYFFDKSKSDYQDGIYP